MDKHAELVERLIDEALEAEEVLSSDGGLVLTYNQARRAMRKVMRQLQSSTPWRGIESAPDVEDGILICDASKPTPAVGVARFLDGQWRGYDLSMGVECCWPTPTHWQPRPLPPSPDTPGLSPTQPQDKKS